MPADTARAAPTEAPQPAHRGCPVDHRHFGQRKTDPDPQPATQAPRQDAAGVWHLYGYAAARALLRAEGTRQAGFMAERLGKLPKTMRDPILFQEGPDHREQRSKVARFFTPKTTDERYRGFMERFADEVLGELLRRGRADLSAMSVRLAVQVAAQVVGLTHSSRPGLAKRIEAFFAQTPAGASRPARLWGFLKTQRDVLRFYLFDVRPAIRARRLEPREDVISHALAEGYGPAEILTECVTYAAAGMATTREFISAAAWHLLEQPELRAMYLAGDEKARYRILHELLRLEPVVGTLWRRTLGEVRLELGGTALTLPAGAKVAVHIYSANADETVVGEDPLSVCPARQLPRSVAEPVLSFGDGHHRCPGAYVAIQESDIFLCKLLALPLTVERWPGLERSELVQGYELREFWLRLDERRGAPPSSVSA